MPLAHAAIRTMTRAAAEVIKQFEEKEAAQAAADKARREKENAKRADDQLRSAIAILTKHGYTINKPSTKIKEI